MASESCRRPVEPIQYMARLPFSRFADSVQINRLFGECLLALSEGGELHTARLTLENPSLP